MPRIVVKSATVVEDRIENGPNAGKIIRSQTVALELGDGYALPFRVGLGTRPAYSVGAYDIDPKSFGLGKYGDLELKRYVDLLAIPAPVKA
jgi:hypothetical protein